MKMAVRGKHQANQLGPNFAGRNSLGFGKTSIITGYNHSSTQDNTLSDSRDVEHQSILSAGAEAIDTTSSVVGTNVTGVQRLRVPY